MTSILTYFGSKNAHTLFTERTTVACMKINHYAFDTSVRGKYVFGNTGEHLLLLFMKDKHLEIH